MHVLVRDFVGEHPLTLDEGQMIYDTIAPALAAGQVVELDFDGVIVAGAPFLNVAIGELFKDHTRETLNRLLLIRNANSVVQPMVQLVMKHSEEYFSSEVIRAAVDNVLKKLAEEV